MPTETVDTIFKPWDLRAIASLKRVWAVIKFPMEPCIPSGGTPCNPPAGGFLGIPAVQRIHQQRLTEAILSQLEMIFGKPAAQPTAIFYKDWARERFTATERAVMNQ